MGLLGDTWDAVTDPIEGIADTLTDTTGESSNDFGDTVETTEDTFNDGAQETIDNTGETIEIGTDGFLDGISGGFDTIEGMLRAFGGAFNWGKGFADIIRGVNSDVANFWEMFMGGFAGFFFALAKAAAYGEAFWDFLTTLNGWEGVGFLLGSFLIVVSAWLVVSGILGLEFLLPPSFAEDVFDAFVGFSVGCGLVFWATNNVMGGVLIAGMGLILFVYALIADEGSFLVAGAPTLVLGLGLTFAAMHFGFLASFIMVAATMYGLYYLTDYVETDVAPKVSSGEI